MQAPKRPVASPREGAKVPGSLVDFDFGRLGWVPLRKVPLSSGNVWPIHAAGALVRSHFFFTFSKLNIYFVFYAAKSEPKLETGVYGKFLGSWRNRSL